MILLLSALVSLALAGWVLLFFGDGRPGISMSIFGAFSICISAFGLVVYCVLVMQYLGAEHKASIMNREYGTNYTQEEVFYASSVIDTVRELDRKRMEINGDIITGK